MGIDLPIGGKRVKSKEKKRFERRDPVTRRPIPSKAADHPEKKAPHFIETGATVPRVGKIIAETAATYLKPMLQKLGGKAPLVVLVDALTELRRITIEGPQRHYVF